MHDDGHRPAALLWDMDGLLVDSEPVWTVAERELFGTWGIAFTPAMKAAMVGLRMDSAVRVMIELGAPHSDGVTAGEVSDWLLRRMVELFAANLPLLPGVRDLLESACAAGVPQALVSSSYRVLVDAVLGRLAVTIGGQPFAVSVAGDEVACGKPHPEPYLTAAARLGVDPAACVALEDTPSGARSGTAAGARVVYCPSVPIAEPPDPRWLVVTALTGLRLDRLGAGQVSPAGRAAPG